MPVLLILLVFSVAGLHGCNYRGEVEAAGENRPAADVRVEDAFMVKAAEAHLAEIGMARLAKLRSKNRGVKNYAGMVLKDHTEALDRLTKLMKEKNVAPPKMIEERTSVDMARAWKLSGPEFDREFANMMVADHKTTLELFRKTSLEAHDPEVQDYVDAVIPTLDAHLIKAQELQSKLFR
jgi:putative membrane protein